MGMIWDYVCGNCLKPHNESQSDEKGNCPYCHADMAIELRDFREAKTNSALDEYLQEIYKKHKIKKEDLLQKFY